MQESISAPRPRHAHFLSTALRYQSMGYHLLPLHFIREDRSCSCRNPSCSSPGKHPMVRNGVKDATNDLHTIQLWWEDAPANIGIATGTPSGLVVLDVDSRHGGLESLAQLEATHGSLRDFASARSGGGGLHFYFRSSDVLLSNKVNLLPGIDFRGEAGYIVAPPSSHKSGDTYQWLLEKPLEPMPAWLFNLLQGKPQLVLATQQNQPSIAEGGRNHFLTSVGGFLKSRGLAEESLESALSALNQSICQPSLPLGELKTICKSLGKYQDWQPLQPLPSSAIEALPFTPETLPTLLKPWILDVCERMQLPLEFMAAPAIIAVSTIIGRKIAIQPLQHDDWQVIPNLWGMLVADPGSMKSSAMSHAMGPISALEKQSRKKFEKLCQERAKKDKDLAIEMEALKSSLKLDWSQGLGLDMHHKKEQLKALNEQPQEKLKEKRFKTNDPTIEKLALIMQDNPQGILLLRDELSGWLESLSKTGREGSREFYLEAWNGNGSFSIDRVGRGSTFTESICLSVFGGIQPQKLQKYMDRYDAEHGQDGFLDRFQLAVYPERKTSWALVDRRPDKAAFDRVMEFFEYMDKIPFEDGQTLVIRFSQEAQTLSDQWRSSLENRICDPEMSDMKKSYLSKYRSLMPSLALIFEVLQSHGVPVVVGKDAVFMALRWCELLESHMNKILNMGRSETSLAQKFLSKIKEGEIFNGQRVRDLYRKKPAGLRTPEEVKEILLSLEDRGFLRLVKETALGGTTETILINPALGGAL